MSDNVREAAEALLAAVQAEQEWGTNCDPDNFGCGCEGTVTSGPMDDEDRPCSSCRAKITKARALALRSALAAPPAATGSVDEADRLDALRAQRAVVTRNYARDPSNENEAALYAICERVYAAERRVAASTGSGAAPTRDAVAEVLLHEAHPDLAPWSLLQLSGHNAAGIVAAVALARRQADAVMARWPGAATGPRDEAGRWMLVVYDPATNRTVETCLCADEADARREAAQYEDTAYLVGVVALVPRAPRGAR